MLRSLIAVMLIAIIFTACSHNAKSNISSMPQSNNAMQGFAQKKYRVNGSSTTNVLQWIDGGNVLAAADGGEISYIDLKNNIMSSAIIDAQYVTSSYSFVYGSDKIFILHSTDANSYSTSAYKSSGEWKLYNGSVHKRDGTSLSKLQALFFDEENGITVNGENKGKAQDDSLVKINRAVWLDTETIALWGLRHLFFYNTSTEALTLADDFSAELPPLDVSSNGETYGIGSVIPFNGGCLYSVHNIDGAFNTKAHIYFSKDKSGRQLAFDGDVFTELYGQSNALAAVEIIYDKQQEKEQTRCSISTPTLKPYDLLFDGRVQLWDVQQDAAITRFIFSGSSSFFTVKVNGSRVEISEYSPAEQGQPELLSVSVEGEVLEYIYTVIPSTGEGQASYAYNDKSGNVKKLEGEYINLFYGNKKGVYVQGTPSPYSPQYVQIVPFA